MILEQNRDKEGTFSVKRQFQSKWVPLVHPGPKAKQRAVTARKSTSKLSLSSVVSTMRTAQVTEIKSAIKKEEMPSVRKLRLMKKGIKGERRFPCGIDDCPAVFTRQHHVKRHHESSMHSCTEKGPRKQTEARKKTSSSLPHVQQVKQEGCERHLLREKLAKLKERHIKKSREAIVGWLSEIGIERPVCCDLCNKSFERKQYLTRHLLGEDLQAASCGPLHGLKRGRNVKDNGEEQ